MFSQDQCCEKAVKKLAHFILLFSLNKIKSVIVRTEGGRIAFCRLSEAGIFDAKAILNSPCQD